MDDEVDTAVDVFGAAPDRDLLTTDRAGATPAQIGRYHVLAPIGRGGMADVYLCELRGPHGFRRQVAIKRLHPGLADDPDVASRFVREATLAARLVHPAICQVYELDEDDAGCFIVMEYLDGITLATALKELARARWLCPIPIVLRLMRALCAGLHAAHELRDGDGAPLGVVHRDVTPSNIVLTSAGQVKLLDFGVAKTVQMRTQIGVVRGKPGYMSPEQLARRPLDRRSDVFSLGIILYEALTISRLFPRTSLPDMIRTFAEAPPPDPRAHRPDLSDAVVAVVQRALARDRDQRYPSAAALATALTDALAPATPAPSGWLAWLVATLRERQGEATSSWTSGAAVPGPRAIAEASTPPPVATPS